MSKIESKDNTPIMSWVPSHGLFVIIQYVVVLFLFATSGLIFAGTVTQVVQYGITWKFDKAYETGTFANGDYWVVGPVTVVSVSPAPSAGSNGSMVNPRGNTVSYDSRISGYQSAYAAKYPFVLQSNQSLVSTISNPLPKVDNKSQNGDYWSALTTAAVLTSVPSPQSSKVFRPPYVGSAYKPYFTTDQLKRELLPRVKPVAGMPKISDYAGKFQKPWIDHRSNWSGYALHPAQNMRVYGRDIASTVSTGAILLMVDDPNIEQLLINFVQLGIDNFGAFKSGVTWRADGGHMAGRLWPILIAGLLFDNNEMKSVNDPADRLKFSELGQTFYDSNNKAQYIIQPTCDPANYAKDCYSSYKVCCTSHTWVGEALASRMMHAEALWNHNAFF